MPRTDEMLLARPAVPVAVPPAAGRRADALQVARFLAAGAVGYVVNLAVYAAAAHGAGIDYRVAAVVSFAVALLTTFVLNRHLTFAAGGGPLAAQLWRYVVVNGAGFATNLVVLVALVDAAGVAKLPAEAIAAAAAAPVNFIGGRLWAFDGVRAGTRRAR